jgi:predicted enzyme related to lactoylglutathione lyase
MSGLKSVIYPVTDLEQAKAMYAAVLGATPTMDEPYYVNFDIDGVAVGLDPNGHRKGMTGPVAYWFVDDVAVSLAELVAAGATELQGISDVGGGNLLASVTDVDGNVIGLMQSA